jgi:amino acid transporter
MTASSQHPSLPRRELTLFDTTSIIVGIIIGSGIYEAVPRIAAAVDSPQVFLATWLLGGLFALMGSLCYAELAAAWPEEGGDYVFLTRAFGRPVGFLFAWTAFWVIRPGSVGAMAFVFAKYAGRVGLGGPALFWASSAVAVLTVVNVLGVRSGKWTQNLLTVAKLGGLAAVVAVGLLWPCGGEQAAGLPGHVGEAGSNFGLAMILVLYAYGGWNDMSYVGAEVRNPERNIFRALLLGAGTVTAAYLMANLAFLQALGFRGVQRAEAVAADVVRLALGRHAERAISALICISALGAINGMLLTGARIYFALGQRHALFRPLGRWNERLQSPVASLVAQAAVTLSVMAGFAHAAGSDGFDRMVRFGLPAFWFFLLLVSASVFWLRRTAPRQPRPVCVPAYPFTPLLFAAGTAYMLYASVAYAWATRSAEAWWSIALLLAGAVLACWEARPAGRDGNSRQASGAAERPV